ncbi:hypothetical protein WAF17_02660 [Bernardetia sp. ABR2-2B]|uniref:hypothetical protein n=1 Tax=Bernardetia sp. ABR2-2B TaxID=3127472 RepID=UPI0030CDE786
MKSLELDKRIKEIFFSKIKEYNEKNERWTHIILFQKKYIIEIEFTGKGWQYNVLNINEFIEI